MSHHCGRKCVRPFASSLPSQLPTFPALTPVNSPHYGCPHAPDTARLREVTSMSRAFFRVVLTTMRLLPRALGVAIAVMLLASPSRAAIDAPSTIAALRIAGTVTGGLMSTSAPEFAQMVAAIQGGDRLRAATIAANSNYAAKYLLRRLAFQMQNPGLDGSKVTDSDGTTFL